MADFTALKNSIRNYIKQNGNAEITGEILQNILISMVVSMGDGAINGIADGLTNEANARTNADGLLQDAINSISTALGDGYTYAGIATPATTPASGRVFYLALQAGTYTNFGGIVVTQGINILKNNNGTWQLDNVIGIDDIPTAGSPNLVMSGGVFANIGAFDISDYNKSGTTLATYADLTAALAALPSEYQKGGMSVKFIQSSDNKYVQYRLMSDTFNTTVANWQGVEDVLKSGSKNLIESGGVYETLYGNNKISEIIQESITGIIEQESGKFRSYNQWFICHVIPVTPDNVIFIQGSLTEHSEYAFLKDNQLINGETPHYANGYSTSISINNGELITTFVPSDAKYLYILGNSEHYSMNFTPNFLSYSDWAYEDIYNHIKSNRINLLDDTTSYIRANIIDDSGIYRNLVRFNSFLIPITQGVGIFIQGNIVTHSEYAFLTNDTLVNDQAPNYATGYSKPISLNTGDCTVVTAPLDANYLYVLMNDTGGETEDYSPAALYLLTDVENGIQQEIVLIQEKINFLPPTVVLSTTAEQDTNNNYQVTDLGSLNGKTWNAMGDSLTEGYTVVNPHTGQNINKNGLYVAQVATELGLTVRNYGRGSLTICKNSNAHFTDDSIVERVLGQVSGLEIEEADIWTIMGGANDLLYNSTVGTPEDSPTNITTIYGALKAIAENLQRRSNNPAIIFIVWAYSSYVDGKNQKAKEIEYAYNWVGERYGIPVLNLSKISGISFVNDRRFTIDGIHLTEEGTNKIKHKISNFIKNNV